LVVSLPLLLLLLLLLLCCRFSKGLAAKAELQQDIIRIIKAGRNDQQQQQQQQDGEQSSVFRYMLDARRQTQTTVSALVGRYSFSCTAIHCWM
jgi:hypothetical protein